MLAIVIVLVLAACQTTPQVVEPVRAPTMEEHLARMQAWHDYADKVCRTYDFEPGTPDYQRCRFQLDLAAQQEAAARKRDLDDAVFRHGLRMSTPPY